MFHLRQLFTIQQWRRTKSEHGSTSEGLALSAIRSGRANYVEIMQSEVGPTSVTIQGGSRQTPMKRTTFGCLMALMMLTCISNTDPDVCQCAMHSSSFAMGANSINCMAFAQLWTL